MAAQLLQTPKRVNITVTDDATALEAVKRLVTGHETKVQIVPSDSPHRCVTWSGGDHVLVRLYKPLRCDCLLYTSPSPRDQRGSRMPSSA